MRLHRRNHLPRWSIVQTFVTLTFLAALGCGDSIVPDTETTEPPRALTYATTSAVYTRGEIIAANLPTVTGTVSSWSVNSALPSGLALDATTGAITGTPTVLQAAAPYIVTARNPGGATSATLSITVNDAAPTALSYATTSAVYTRGVVIASNVPTVTGSVSDWSITPALPAGVTLDAATGEISGTPTALQAATTYIVTATNTGGTTTATISITVNDAAPTALSYATTSAVYTRDVVIAPNLPTVTGSVVAWSVTPALPAGLTLDTTTGAISGTPSTLQVSIAYTVTATNSGGSTAATISIIVNDDGPVALSYATMAATYTRGVVIATNLPTVTGSVVAWSVSPALPAGLTLDTTTGAISGTPSTLQVPSMYTVTATNSGGTATATLSITVNDAAPTALSYAMTSAVYTRGVVIASNTPTITGSVTAWAVAPVLPAGLTLDTTTGVISGTPSALQPATAYAVTATNTGGTATTTISITVNDAAPTALSYATTAAVYTRGVVITTNQPTVTGSVIAWSVTPALPAGLTLNTATGAISGTPSTLQAAATYTVTATNSGGATTTTLSITVNDAAPTALSYGTTAAVYTRDAVIASNTPTVTGSVSAWSVAPALPVGLTLDTATGVISGTPSALQTATVYTVTATNTGGFTTAALSITVNDAAPTALSYATTAAVYTRGVVITTNLPTVTGSVVAWSASPALPAGLALNTSTGAISGTPSTLQAAASYTVTATNSGGSTTAVISIAVDDAAPTALSYATTSAVYTRDVVISSNTPTVTGSVSTWAIAPSLPAGLALDPTTGIIAGTPTMLQAATSYTVTATNSGGFTTAALSITVNDAAPTALSYASASAVYTRNAAIASNTPTVTGSVIAWSVAPALPTGLILDTTTGIISGTPTAVQTAASYTVTATNSGGATTATLSIAVSDDAPSALTYATPTAVYTINVVIADNTPTVTGSVSSWAVAPSLPAGLVLDTTTGKISGTPTSLQAAATYTVTATNGSGTTTTTISIAVDDAAPSALSYATPTAVYTVDEVIASNDPTVTGSVTSWSVSPTLPAGLTLDTTTGIISGTPSVEQAAATYTVTAANAGGSTTTAITITVEAGAVAVPYAITCTFSTAAGGSVTCPLVTSADTVARADNEILFGGQNVHAVLLLDDVTYDSATGAFEFSAKIQNLMGRTIGSIDNVTTSPSGVRLVLDSTTVTAGTGLVTIDNPDGTAAFANPNRPYFQFSEKVASTATTMSSKAIHLTVPSTVGTFTASFEIATKVAVTLVINEVLTNPGGTISDANGEWFEIYNGGPFRVNMAGFRIGDSSALGDRPTHLIAGDLFIPPGGYLVFGNTTNTTNNGGVVVDYAYGAALALANSLDAVRLISSDGFTSDTNVSTGDVAVQGNPANVEIDRVVYKTAAISAQNGISRELKNPGLANADMDSGNWGDASVTEVYGPAGRGTPRAQNSQYTP